MHTKGLSLLLLAVACQQADSPDASLAAFDGEPWAVDPAAPQAPPEDWAGDYCQPSHLVPGETVQFEYHGANPGDRIVFGAGTGLLVEDGFTVEPWPELLINLWNPWVLDIAVADSSGTAVATVVVPLDAPVGMTLFTQAVNMTQGTKTFAASNVVVPDYTYEGACSKSNVCDYSLCGASDLDGDGILDGDDLCPLDYGEQLDCYGDCVPDYWLGDGWCDYMLDCAEFAFDAGDCDSTTYYYGGCGYGEIEGCDGYCYPEWFLGDGGCDSGLDCAEWAYDAGDCDSTYYYYGGCGYGEIEGCDGYCYPEWFLGDGACDSGLDCAEWAYDYGDCDSTYYYYGGCGYGEVEGCDGACYPEWLLGDGWCDSRLDCAEWAYDYGDCDSTYTYYGGCGPDEVVGCDGYCYPAGWLGDGWCDAPLDCAEWSYDFGDCDTGGTYYDPFYLGEYSLSSGPEWTGRPATYTCQEACAVTFGGTAGDYFCSSSPSYADRLAHYDTNGIYTCDAWYADNHRNCDFYDPGCQSAWVRDNCSGYINYCHLNSVYSRLSGRAPGPAATSPSSTLR